MVRVLHLLAAAACLLVSDATAFAAISIHARAVQPGEVVVVSVTGPDPSTPVHVRAFGHSTAAYRVGDAWKAIVGIDLDVKPGAYRLTVDPGGESSELKVLPKTFRTRRLSVDEAFVTPPASAQARITREAEMMAAAWRASAPERLWATAFVRPVPHEANSAFGTRSIFNGKPRNPHGGADFLSPAGTPVAAPAGGRVVIAQDLYYSGNTVIIDHGLGVFSMLAHLSRIDVQAGTSIEAGDRVGLVGATGRVTGPHLHWAVRINDARVDPLSLLQVLAPSR